MDSSETWPNTTTTPADGVAGQIVWSRAVAILLAILACAGTLGNLLVIGAVMVERRLRVRGNAFIVNLAVADLILTAYIMPIGIATSQYKLKPFSEHLCDLNAALLAASVGVSTQTLMLIALERFVHICKKTKYDSIFTSKLIGLYIVMAWIYAIAWAIQGYTGWTEYVYGADFYLCLFYAPKSVSYSVCVSVFGVAVPLLVMTVCYVRIFRVVRRSKAALSSHSIASTPSYEVRMRKRQQREHQFVFMLFVLVSVFFVCCSPGAVVIALSGILGSDRLPALAYTITIWIALCNSALNSAIYGIMNNNFRRGYSYILQRAFCCRKIPPIADGASSLGGTIRSGYTATLRTDTLVRNSAGFSVKSSQAAGTEISTLPMSISTLSKVTRSEASSLSKHSRDSSSLSDTKKAKVKAGASAVLNPAKLERENDQKMVVDSKVVKQSSRKSSSEKAIAVIELRDSDRSNPSSVIDGRTKRKDSRQKDSEQGDRTKPKRGSFLNGDINDKNILSTDDLSVGAESQQTKDKDKSRPKKESSKTTTKDTGRGRSKSPKQSNTTGRNSETDRNRALSPRGKSKLPEEEEVKSQDKPQDIKDVSKSGSKELSKKDRSKDKKSKTKEKPPKLPTKTKKNLEELPKESKTKSPAPEPPNQETILKLYLESSPDRSQPPKAPTAQSVEATGRGRQKGRGVRGNWETSHGDNLRANLRSKSADATTALARIRTGAASDRKSSDRSLSQEKKNKTDAVRDDGAESEDGYLAPVDIRRAMDTQAKEQSEPEKKHSGKTKAQKSTSKKTKNSKEKDLTKTAAVNV